MKRFRDLAVFGEREDLEALISSIEGRLADEWSRDRSSEKRIYGVGDVLGGKGFIFVRSANTELPAVALFLVLRDRRLTVPNIVPDGVELSIERYNGILTEFYLKFVHPAAQEAGLTVELSSDELTIEEAFRPRAMELLRRFSVCANKFICHPADQRRWLDFLIEAHLHSRSNRDYSDGLLAKWLRDDGWRSDKVERLISEYEFVGELLKALEQKELLAPWARQVLQLADPSHADVAPVSKETEGGPNARLFQGTILRWVWNLQLLGLTAIANLSGRLRRTVMARALP